jgi:hypothetical protein
MMGTMKVNPNKDVSFNINHWDFDATFFPRHKSTDSTESYTHQSVGGFYIRGKYLWIEGETVTH